MSNIVHFKNIRTQLSRINCNHTSLKNIIHYVYTFLIQHLDYFKNYDAFTHTASRALKSLNRLIQKKIFFVPNPSGRFKVCWVRGINLENNQVLRNGIKYPGNEHIGAFGCDSYDISGTVDGKGSKGALHGLTKLSMEDAPANTFFLEY